MRCDHINTCQTTCAELVNRVSMTTDRYNNLEKKDISAVLSVCGHISRFYQLIGQKLHDGDVPVIQWQVCDSVTWSWQPICWKTTQHKTTLHNTVMCHNRVMAHTRYWLGAYSRSGLTVLGARARRSPLLTMASIDSQLLVSDPDSRKFLEFPLKFTFRLM